MLDFCSGIGDNGGINLDCGPISLVLSNLIIFKLHILFYDVVSFLSEKHVALNWLPHAATSHQFFIWHSRYAIGWRVHSKGEVADWACNRNVHSINLSGGSQVISYLGAWPRQACFLPLLLNTSVRRWRLYQVDALVPESRIMLNIYETVLIVNARNMINISIYRHNAQSIIILIG